MAIQILREAVLTPTSIYFEIKLYIEVVERSWSSSDPVDEVVEAVADKLVNKAFDDDRLRDILAHAGYTVVGIETDLVDGGGLAHKEGNKAYSYTVYGTTYNIKETITPKEAKKLANVIYQEFPLKETSYPLVGIPIDGYPLAKSDLDKQDAEIDCRVIALSINSNGKNVYFS